MENRKCVQCGLVNFPNVIECARCNAFIPRALPETVGVNPFERDGTTPFNPLPLLAIAAFLIVAAIIGYNMFGSEPSKAATQSNALTPAESEAYLETLRQQGAAEIQKDAAARKKVDEDQNKIRSSPPKPDFTKMRTPECKVTGYSSNPATGTYTPNQECK